VRNDRASVDELLDGGYDRVVVSPGPCTPNEAGISLEAVRRFPEAGVPTLGVCLGHQSLAQAFGGTSFRHVPGARQDRATDRARRAARSSEGLPSPLGQAGRYHALVVDDDDGARTPFEVSPAAGRVVMAIRHREACPPRACSSSRVRASPSRARRSLENFLRDPATTLA
jgi:anthranilate/para-aminobenzoate synthase component II